jgi:probable rRNA maturation factor
MGINETTDVLTFDLREPVGSPDSEARQPLDTDIMVCIDEAARQVVERGADAAEVRRELLLYAVHGILHCLDHDDHDDDDFDRMHAAEDEILKAIGVGPVFHPAR